ncbi:hypothetical protein [Candidatus Uabimicrobium amorphum]|uniref:Uncharacterized protein n=1 Tax=Uabimicrobium amorphum TaxID=2596890 RepID=A0A5S9IJH9_UABAM|nr:hypothetical protein [Candidatus Uabimicrobium amorphum]BBM82671.1 hypothetical protein UABAM_01014 [Candidatus Uabimicrobium amorphum]
MLLPEGETKDFLGREFLTWLWFYGEQNNWHFSFSDGDSMEYGMDELLVMQGDDANCMQKLSGPVPIKAPEAQVALLEGKKVSTTRVVFVHGQQEWTFTISGDNFNISSLKLISPTTSDIEERFAELSDDLEQVTLLFDKVYTTFLQLRISEEWHKDILPQMKEWVAQKAENAD